MCTQFFSMKQEKEPFAAIAKSKKAEYAINIQQYNMQLVTILSFFLKFFFSSFGNNVCVLFFLSG